MVGYVIDIESQKLYPNYGLIWVIVIKQIGVDRKLILYPYLSTPEEIKKQLIEFIFADDQIPFIVGHNYCGFDGWCLWKEYGLDMQLGPDLMGDYKVKYFDTLYASQFLLPDRVDGHSLKSWGTRFNDHKIDYYNLAIQLGVIKKGDPKGSEFKQHTPEMTDYCVQDVLIAEKLFLQLYEEIKEQNVFNQFYNGQKGFYLMKAQEFSGFKFDLELAKKLIPQIKEMIQEIRKQVEPNLPKRNLKKTEQQNYKFPASIYNKDGGFSANMKKFIIKHNGELTDRNTIILYNEEYKLIPHQDINLKLPISLDDQSELKDFFISQGWYPTMWNFKKDPKTKKKIRGGDGEYIKLSPKIQESQRICPNLLELDGSNVREIVKFLSLKNRLSTLESTKDDTKGWVNNPRLEFDGRISAGASGIASTHRQKHTTINLQLS